MERSVPLKEKFNNPHSSPRNERQGLPHRATGKTPGQEAEAGARARFRPEPSLGFLRERQGRAGKMFRIG